MTFTSSNSSKKIMIGSMNELKLEAARRACRVVWPNREVDVIGFPAKSRVHNQPLGLMETFRGAQNRAQYCLNKVPTAQLAIGIENGIWQFEPDETTYYHDIAFVVLVTRYSANPIFSMSASVPMPKKLCEHVAGSKNRMTTVGQLMAKEKPGIDAGDPHSHITNNTLSREFILLQPLVIVLSRISENMLD